MHKLIVMRKPTSAVLAANVRAELARRGLKQRDLAAMLNQSQPYVSRRLTGEAAFNVDELTQIAGFLGVPAASLLAEVAA